MKAPLAAILALSLGGQCLAELIGIGTRKQLFFDDHMIESRTGARQVLNPAVKVAGNPVVRQDRPWEGNDIKYGSLVYDPERRLFRMWYWSQTLEKRDNEDHYSARKACYAVSRDGYHWEKPELGLVEFEESTANNILGEESYPQEKHGTTTDPGRFKGGIFLDPVEKDPRKRYKALSRSRAEGAVPGTDLPKSFRVWNLFFSPDAFRWTPYPGNPVIEPKGVPKLHPKGEPWARRKGYQGYLWGPTSMMGWDPIRQVYAAYMENCQHKRCPLKKRVIGRAESPDLVNWSEPSTLLVPDGQDPPDLQFYALHVSVYEGYYVGMLWCYRASSPATRWIQFVFSRDGIRWDRRYRRPFIPLGPPPEFDSAVIAALAPIVHDNEIFCLYYGKNFRDRRLDQIGGPAVGAMGLAVLPLDGWVSLENDDQTRNRYAEVVTLPFTFSGSRLQVNVAPQVDGESARFSLNVEILAPDHFRVKGYSFEESDSITRGGVARVASWNGEDDLSSLAGKPIKLKFYLKNARLFSYQFVP